MQNKLLSFGHDPHRFEAIVGDVTNPYRQPVKIYDLAVKMITLAGLEPGRDIEIRETGLRPGEKLYEELLSSKENTLPTHHGKIMIGKRCELIR